MAKICQTAFEPPRTPPAAGLFSVQFQGSFRAVMVLIAIELNNERIGNGINK